MTATQPSTSAPRIHGVTELPHRPPGPTVAPRRLRPLPPSTPPIAPRRRPTLHGPAWTARLIELFSRWLHRARTRRELAALDERARADVGLRAEDIRREARKPFWRS